MVVLSLSSSFFSLCLHFIFSPHPFMLCEVMLHECSCLHGGGGIGNSCLRKTAENSDILFQAGYLLSVLHFFLPSCVLACLAFQTKALTSKSTWSSIKHVKHPLQEFVSSQPSRQHYILLTCQFVFKGVKTKIKNHQNKANRWMRWSSQLQENSYWTELCIDRYIKYLLLNSFFCLLVLVFL